MDYPAVALFLLLAEARARLLQVTEEEGGSEASTRAWVDTLEHAALVELARLLQTEGST
jgi:hypothetical protein